MVLNTLQVMDVMPTVLPIPVIPDINIKKAATAHYVGNLLLCSQGCRKEAQLQSYQ